VIASAWSISPIACMAVPCRPCKAIRNSLSRFGTPKRSEADTSHWESSSETRIGIIFPRTPTPERQHVVLVDATTLRKAKALIESCQHCNPEGAGIPFDNILDRVTRSDPSVTDYVLEHPAKCPNCRREILEKSLIEPA
jgi:hypothetical protein